MELKQISDKQFPIMIDKGKAIDIIQKALKKKGHIVELAKDNIYITITPYWFLFYDIDCNIDGNYKHISGQTALSALTNKVDETVTSLFKYEKPKVTEDIGLSRTERLQINIKDGIVDKEEAKKTITKYLCSKFNVTKDNISLSGIELIYVPKWKYRLEEYKLQLDAVSGKINNFDIIQEKEQSNSELFKEMLEDLKSPMGIPKYIFNVFKQLFLGVAWFIKELGRNYKSIIVIVLIALVIYLIFG
jgi:hypothetical protein